MIYSTTIAETLKEIHGETTNVAGAEAAVRYYNWLREAGRIWEV